MIFSGSCSICDYAELLLPSLFVANIASITLTGQFFKQIDTFTRIYLHNFDDSTSDIIETTFDNKEAKEIDKGIKKIPTQKEIKCPQNTLLRTIILTMIFFISELFLIIPYLHEQIYCINTNNEGNSAELLIFIIISLIIFTFGLSLMVALLVLKYLVVILYKKASDNIKYKERAVLQSAIP